MIPLYKKRAWDDTNNFRGLCLLGMRSKVLGRVIAKRVCRWADHLNLLDDKQNGYMIGRFTADMMRMMVRMQEDMVNCKRRVNEEGGGGMNEGEWPRETWIIIRGLQTWCGTREWEQLLDELDYMVGVVIKNEKDVDSPSWWYIAFSSVKWHHQNQEARQSNTAG